MASARKFLFGDDFRGPRAEPASERAGTGPAAEEALRHAFESGVQAGRRQAEDETSRRTTEALERLAAEVPSLVARTDLSMASVESDALHFFDRLARKLAGSALIDKPLAAVADAAIATFRHLRGVPHLAVRVDPARVEACEALLRGLAREHGFEGRLIVIGDEGLSDGDARLDWADGGLVRDRAAFASAVEDVIEAARMHTNGNVEP